MIVGHWPFEYELDHQNIRKTIKQIMAVKYEIPNYLNISQDCRDLISHIFVANPAKRITINEIKSHPWFLKDLPEEFTEKAQAVYYGKENQVSSLQSIEDVMKIVNEAKPLPAGSSKAKILCATSGTVLFN